MRIPAGLGRSIWTALSGALLASAEMVVIERRQGSAALLDPAACCSLIVPAGGVRRLRLGKSSGAVLARAGCG
jgi:hypothetical protein